jgi:hypothetical protein
LGDGSQPVSAGAGPVATDCLYILRVAVDLDSCTPDCMDSELMDVTDCRDSCGGSAAPLTLI